MAGWETCLRVEERADEIKEREFGAEYGWSERRAQATPFGSRPSDVKMGFEGRVKEGGAERRRQGRTASRRQGRRTPGGRRLSPGGSRGRGTGDPHERDNGVMNVFAKSLVT